MSDQLQQLAFEILEIFAKPVADWGAKRLVDYLSKFTSSYPEPEKTFQVMFGGTYFQTSRETFLRHELPKTLEFLVNLPPDERNNRLRTAMQETGDDPEKIIVQLIRAAQEERRKKFIR